MKIPNSKNSDTIFTDSFPLLGSNQALMALQKEYGQYDPYYVTSGAIKERRQLFDDLWQKYKDHADPNFLDDVKYRFHNRTWEMYVGNCLLERGVEFLSKAEGPDFILDGAYLECVAITLGENLKFPKLTGKPTIRTVPNNEIQLRITSAISSKREQYLKWKKKKWFDAQVPYVLVINTHVGFSDFPDMPRIIKVLYGIGSSTISFDFQTKRKDSYHQYEKELENRNSSPVNKHIFDNPEYNFISAVVFSGTNVINSPKEIGDDMRIVYNPNAMNKIGKEQLAVIREYETVVKYRD